MGGFFVGWRLAFAERSGAFAAWNQRGRWPLIALGVTTLLTGCAANGFAVKDPTEREHTYAVVVAAPDYIYVNTLATTIFQNKSFRFDAPNWPLETRMKDKVMATVGQSTRGAVMLPAALDERVATIKRSFMSGQPTIKPELATEIANATGADRLLLIKVVNNSGDGAGAPSQSAQAGNSVEAANAGAVRFQRAYMGTRHAHTMLLASIHKYELPSGQLRKWGSCTPQTLDDPNPWFSRREDVTPAALDTIKDHLLKLSDSCVDEMMTHMNLQDAAA